jgi:hypothetical protein
MITDVYFWAENEITQKVLRDLRDEADRIRERITSGILTTNPDLEREYCRAVGYLDGLKFIEKAIRDLKDEDRTST